MRNGNRQFYQRISRQDVWTPGSGTKSHVAFVFNCVPELFFHACLQLKFKLFFQGHCQDYEMGSEMCARLSQGRLDQTALYTAEKELKSSGVGVSSFQLPIVFQFIVAICFIRSILS